MGYYRDPQRNIVLTGFTCAGKSLVGRMLARYLRRNFIDVPMEVERRAKLSFHNLTGLGQQPDNSLIAHKLVMELAYRRGVIAALSHNTLENEDLLRELKVSSYIVFLDAHFEELWRRIQNDPARRKLAQGVQRGDLLLRLQQLRPYYERCDLQMFNADLTPERTARLITHCYLT